MQLSPIALLAVSVVVGVGIALVINQYLRRAAPTDRQYSLRTHIFSALTLVLVAAAVGISAIVTGEYNAFTIPFSVVVGLVGIVLLIRRAMELNDLKRRR